MEQAVQVKKFLTGQINRAEVKTFSKPTESSGERDDLKKAA